MVDRSDDVLFAAARRAVAMDVDDSGESDDDDGSTLVRLENGGWHVCTGINCPHAVQSRENDHSHVCGLSGRFLGINVEAAHDASWTGRSCTSADPDMQSGTMGSAAWRGKRSAFSASALAYSKAGQMTVDDVTFQVQAPASAANASTGASDDAKDVKRGAPCIVDIDEQALETQRRTKALRRITQLQDKSVQTRLINEAATVVVRLFSVVASNKAAVSSKDDRAVSGSAATLNDPRLENYDFVLNMALRRYAARCKEKRVAPSLSEIHDVCLASNKFVKQRKKNSQGRVDAGALRKIAVSGKTIELCSQLIFTLWSAICSTPYFVQHQTGDSYRPFAAGVMYALKRGLRLPNNVTLVPAVEILANQLPTLRSSTATPAARQLQQSSHRGLCAIARGISSIETMSSDDQREIMKKLKIVAGIAARLVNFVTDAAKAVG